MSTVSKVPRAIATASAAVASIFTPSKTRASDEAIERQFKESYVCRVYLNNDAVTIDVHDGVAKLTGTVADESRKRLAEETALGIHNVTRVDNQLATEYEAAAENSDLWIARKVRLALLMHRNVNSTDTTIDVTHGVVTLTGEASSLAQKELTGEYAGDIANVVTVENNLTVATAPVETQRTEGERLDDASVVAQVRTALYTHRSTSSIATGVSARDGVVTLTGIARNAAEKSLVGKLASDIRGITDVRNEMTVQAAPV